MASKKSNSNYQKKTNILNLGFYEMETIKTVPTLEDKLEIYGFLFRLFTSYPSDGEQEYKLIKQVRKLCRNPPHCLNLLDNQPVLIKQIFNKLHSHL
jgi:hypothetical protein